ncbi:MAG: hypothetical protein ACLSGS_01675 [Adlercreutzia sp.]
MDFYMFCQVCALLKMEREEAAFQAPANVSRSNFDVSISSRATSAISPRTRFRLALEFEFTESVVFDRTGEINQLFGASTR